MGKERSGDCVRLAEADPLLTRDVPLDAAEIVRRRLVASVVEIPADEGQRQARGRERGWLDAPRVPVVTFAARWT